MRRYTFIGAVFLAAMLGYGVLAFSQNPSTTAKPGVEVPLVTPGPGWVVILLGLGLLAAEFVWARRLMDRIKHEGTRIKDTVLGKPEPARPNDPPQPPAQGSAPGDQIS